MFNFVITMCVGLIMLMGAGLTYKYRMMERELDPPGTVYVKGSGLAPLPKWDDKNCKGLVYKPAGASKSASNSAPKQNR